MKTQLNQRVIQTAIYPTTLDDDIKRIMAAVNQPSIMKNTFDSTIKYSMEVEIEDNTETEENLNFQEIEAYLRKTLFHLRHRTLHSAEGDNSGIAVRITLTAIKPH